MIEAHTTRTHGEMSTAQHAHRTTRTQIVLAWTVVTIPLLWGVLQTLEKALALFQ